MSRMVYVPFLILLLSTSCFGWHVNTHLQMTRDAISLMPEDFQKVFTEHQKYVEAGIKDPDEIVKDWQNHYYIPSDPPEGGAIDRIEKIIAVVQTKIKSGNTLDIGKQLTYLAHYIGDLWTPEYLIKQSTMPDQMFTQDNQIIVFFTGFKKPIEDYREYLTRRAEWRWKVENSKQVSTLLYSEAVNDIARVWLSLWKNSGHELDHVKAAAIVHERGALSVNFERLLIEEGTHWDMWYAEDDYVDRYAAHYDEMSRLSESVVPTDDAMAARAQLRNQQMMMSKLNPNAPFSMLETSLRTVGDKDYLITRVRNQGKQNIVSLSLMYPGIKGPVAQAENLRPGQVTVLEAQLPPGSSKDKIQIVFATGE